MNVSMVGLLICLRFMNLPEVRDGLADYACVWNKVGRGANGKVKE
jgi:hypothetical protein